MALNQAQRAAAAPAAIKSRRARLQSIFGSDALLQVTSVMLEKANPDAIQSLRDLLQSNSIYNYEKQPLGADKSRAVVPVEYLSIAAGLVVRATPIVLNLYRSDNAGKADRRFSLSWPDPSLRFAVDDFVVFVVTKGREVLLINISEGLEPTNTSKAFELLVEAAVNLSVDFPESDSAELLGGEEDDGFDSPVIRSAQGYMHDVELKKKIENFAVASAIAFYEQLGATDIVELGKPYDLKLSLGDAEVHVEVKGSRKPIDSVFVTRNEVTHAQTYSPTHLIVIDEIDYVATESGEWKLQGGRLRHWGDWLPSEESLTVIQYAHVLSAADSQSSLPSDGSATSVHT